MYDELTTDLRRAANTWLAEEYKVCAEAVRYLLKESADAIEELQATLCNWCAVCPEDKRDLSTCEIYESCRAKPTKEEAQ